MSTFDSITEGMESRIAALTQQLSDMTADRDSEHRWAEDYHAKWQAAEKECNELTEKLMRSNQRCAKAEEERDAAVARLESARTHSVVDAASCPLCKYEDGKFIEACTPCKERDSVEALAKEAVEELSSAYLLLSRAGHNWVGEYDFDEHKVLDGEKKRITAFLSRPDVKAMGGGK